MVTKTTDKIKILKGFRKVFIHIDGYVFRSTKNKRVIIPIKMVNGVPKVKIGGKNVNLVFLLIEYFGEVTYSQYEFENLRFKYKLINSKIPFYTISLDRNKYKEMEDDRIYLFKCDKKAKSSNGRVSQISTITEYDVFNCLLRTDFKCTYCNSKLNKNTWELDHVTPISKGGQNKQTNIASSCKKCNRMKSNLEISDFIYHLSLILENYKGSSFNKAKGGQND